jgi:hypothetical protein
MAGQRHREASPSECAFASIGRRVSPHPLEGLEPQAASASVYSVAQRAHYRLSFPERLARNVRTPGAGPVTIKVFGVSEAFATFLGLPTI